MKVKFRQTTKFGCGSFTLANLFDDHRFVEQIPMEQGERFIDLIMKMQSLNYEIMPCTIWQTIPSMSQGNKLTYNNNDVFQKPDNREVFEISIPYMMTIVTGHEMYHNVALLHNLSIDSASEFYVIDSGKENVTCHIDIFDLCNSYHIVGVHAFTPVVTNDNSEIVMIHNNQLCHIYGL